MNKFIVVYRFYSERQSAFDNWRPRFTFVKPFYCADKVSPIFHNLSAFHNGFVFALIRLERERDRRTRGKFPGKFAMNKRYNFIPPRLAVAGFHSYRRQRSEYRLDLIK